MTRDWADYWSDYCFDRAEEQWAAEDEAYFAAKSERCDDCGYRLAAPGHHYSCNAPTAIAERRAVLQRQGL